MVATPILAQDERQILHRLDRALSGPEREPRYQLERRDDHPLARSAQLLDVLADLEARALVVSELHFPLTAAVRPALAKSDR